MIPEQFIPPEIESNLDTSFMAELNEEFLYLPETGQLIYRDSGQLAGTLTQDGYLTTNFRARDYPVHRLAYCLYYGHMPRDQIDHINRIKTDNRIVNLRDVSAEINTKNRTPGKNNKTGVVGVTWNRHTNRWQAIITYKRKNVYIGSFKNFINAVKARHYAEQKFGYTADGMESSSELYLNNAKRMTFYTNIELTTKKESKSSTVESEWQFFCLENMKKIDKIVKREKLVESLINGR